MMRQASLILAGVGLFAISLSSWASLQAKAPQRPTAEMDENTIKTILSAKDGDAAADGYMVLFKAAKVADLRRLQMNPSDSIAIQAAWEIVDLALPEKAGPCHIERSELCRFLGFLEGRARAQIPQWWAESILDARANHRGNVYTGVIDFEGQDPKVVGPILAQKARFDQEGGKSIVRVGSAFTPVPADLRARLKNGRNLTAFMTPSHCFVAAYDDYGYTYKLACVDRSSAKIRWVSEVWASAWGRTTITGLHLQPHLVEVAQQGDRIVVFGISTTGFYVESFRIDDGVNVLRFSNSYDQCDLGRILDGLVP